MRMSYLCHVEMSSLSTTITSLSAVPRVAQMSSSCERRAPSRNPDTRTLRVTQLVSKSSKCSSYQGYGPSFRTLRRPRSSRILATRSMRSRPCCSSSARSDGLTYPVSCNSCRYRRATSTSLKPTRSPSRSWRTADLSLNVPYQTGSPPVLPGFNTSMNTRCGQRPGVD